MIAIRCPTNPIIRPEMDPGIGMNINGPSLIKTPEWLPNRLGKYYLYFAHHRGTFIRLAYANHLAGPWRIYQTGALHLSETVCHDHIASPDVHVDESGRRIIMYFHGPFGDAQRSFLAISADGLSFTARNEVLGRAYFRVFKWEGHYFALAMPGVILRSHNGFGNFELGPTLFEQNIRHTAVRLSGDRLDIFHTRVGDCPEQILVSTVVLSHDWKVWYASSAKTVLVPERNYEGAELTPLPSERGAANGPVRQVRDPCIYLENNRTYLLYSVAGESGIALAEILDG